MLNVLRVILGSIFPKAFIFIFNVLAARVLSPEAFGFYSYVKSFYNFFESIVSSSLNPYAISELANKRITAVQFFYLYMIYAIASSFFAVFFFFNGDVPAESILYMILFGAVLGSIINAFLYVVLVVGSNGQVILTSTSICSVLLMLVLMFLSPDTTVVAVCIALSFNVLDLLIKIVIIVVKKVDITLGSDFKLDKSFLFQLPYKASFSLMLALILNGGIFLYQRTILAQTDTGLTEMAYLEVTMQVYAVITICLTAVANAVMSKSTIKLFNFEFSALTFLVFICVIVTVIYVAVLIFYGSYLGVLYNLEYTRGNITSAVFMVSTYSFAFYSVRLVLQVNRQYYNLISTAIASCACFVVYFFYDINAMTIAYSYSVFYLCLGFMNILMCKVLYVEKNYKNS